MCLTALKASPLPFPSTHAHEQTGEAEATLAASFSALYQTRTTLAPHCAFSKLEPLRTPHTLMPGAGGQGGVRHPAHHPLPDFPRDELEVVRHCGVPGAVDEVRVLLLLGADTAEGGCGGADKSRWDETGRGSEGRFWARGRGGAVQLTQTTA